ncbi:hypothetical protein NL676_013230 [Syzygium grande]|nr:hypothetical protein NL676_013230 [Syzygium grande]
MAEEKEEVKTFKELGICERLLEACDTLGWKNPTKIQVEAIPHALEGKDMIGLAQTGSGKTGAFALPILQALLDSPQAFFACVLFPTSLLVELTWCNRQLPLRSTHILLWERQDVVLII